jgi:hypothetical protein
MTRIVKRLLLKLTPLLLTVSVYVVTGLPGGRLLKLFSGTCTDEKLKYAAVRFKGTVGRLHVTVGAKMI